MNNTKYAFILLLTTIAHSATATIIDEKIQQALKDAQISEQATEQCTAKMYVTLLGPLGADNAIKALIEAEQTGILSNQEVFHIINSATGTALANYFEMSPAQFRAKAYAAGIKNIASEIGENIKDTVHDSVETVKEKVSNFGSWLNTTFSN